MWQFDPCDRQTKKKPNEKKSAGSKSDALLRASGKGR
jgi:hypothetical protein